MLTAFHRVEGQPLKTFQDPGQVRGILDRHEGILWVDLEGSSPEPTAILQDVFRFQPLLVQESLRYSDRPKADFTDACVYAILHAPSFRERGGWVGVDTTDIDVFLGDGFLVTYHPEPIGAITALRDRCRATPEKYLGRGCDFLLYHVEETIVESFFAVIDSLEVRLDTMEKEIFSRPSAQFFKKIVHFKRDLMHLRRILGPEREVFSLLGREESRFIGASARQHLRTAYDHISIVHDVVEIDRDMVVGLRDTYLSFVSNRMSEVMKVLTIITTCLMPPTLLAGIWGMNFEHLPLRDWPYAFWAFLTLCGGMGGGMLYAFRRQKWM
ncbi:MAG: magnesium/cobalt transporter CorA [Planctomycetes bacterium]|nr:magnesium/cobalt transporter CorA [Planctomycetota bacterium]